MSRAAFLLSMIAATFGSSAGATVQATGPQGAEGPAAPRLVPLWIARPDYPRIAHAARVQGVVIVDIEVAVDGRVSSTRITRSIPLLDHAALDALKETYFVCERCGTTSMHRTMAYDFSLNDDVEPAVFDVTAERIRVGVPAVVMSAMPQMARR